MRKRVPYEDDGCMIMYEGGTRCKSLSMVADGMLSMFESVCRCDEVVSNDEKDEAGEKGLTFSFGTVN